MDKLTIAQSKLLNGYRYVVAPCSEYCENHYFRSLMAACECFAGYQIGSAEILEVAEYIKRKKGA